MDDTYSIIIVDDDSDLRDILGSFFSSEGLPCETFSRAETALERLAKASFDVMVADIRMPGMEGLELTERAKKLRPDLNVIIMTGFIDLFSYDDAIAAGASDFIKKPFGLNELQLRIRHVRLQEKLRALSITDELTGLPNRRGFFALAEQQFKAAARTRGDLVLLFSDLDDFKKINDTWGHQEGDKALSAMAGIFRETYRDSDVIARMSGDEFAILLIDMPEESLLASRARLNKNIAEFNSRPDGSYTLSASVGMAVYNHDSPCSVDEMLRQADTRMYEEKQRKKNGGR